MVCGVAAGLRGDEGDMHVCENFDSCGSTMHLDCCVPLREVLPAENEAWLCQECKAQTLKL